MHPYLASARPHLFGHRGASGEAPENTLVAFERALAQGAGYLEMDCHGTRDGEIVVLHDPEVDRVTDGNGPVRELSFNELSALDAGFRFSPDGVSFPFRASGVRVPRLAEVLEAFPAARINLEVKQQEPAIAEAVIQLIRAAGAEPRTLLAAAEEPVMDTLHQLAPGTAMGSSIKDVADFFQAMAEDRLERFKPRGDALQIPTHFGDRPLITPESVAAARRVGLAMHVWTVNDETEIRALLELGVDGLMSDYPELLVRIACEASR